MDRRKGQTTGGSDEWIRWRDDGVEVETDRETGGTDGLE
jgi:hypothetical protein